jgi:hypothetical protein
MGLFSGVTGFLKDVATGDWTNAGNRIVGDNVSNAVSNVFDVGNGLGINELKTNGIIPNELNNPTGAALALGAALAGPGLIAAAPAGLSAMGSSLASTIGGGLGSIGLGGLASGVGTGIGTIAGSAESLLGGAAGLIGTAGSALASNPLLLGVGGGLLGKSLAGGGSSSEPQAVGAGTAAPTYDKTLLDAFNAQLAIEPQLLKANQLYQPQWLALQAQNQQQTAQSQLDLMKALYPQAGTMEAAYQNQLRQNELQQIAGPNNALQQYQNAFNALTPGVQQAINSTGQLAQGAMNRALYQPQFSSYEQGIPNPYQAAQMSAMQGMPISSMYGRPMIPAYPGIQQQMPQLQQIAQQQFQMPQPGTEAYYQMVPDARPGAGLPRDDGNGPVQQTVSNPTPPQVYSGPTLNFGQNTGALTQQPISLGNALAAFSGPQQGPITAAGQAPVPIAPPTPVAPPIDNRKPVGYTYRGPDIAKAPMTPMAASVATNEPIAPQESTMAAMAQQAQAPVQQPAQTSIQQPAQPPVAPPVTRTAMQPPMEMQPPVRQMQPEGFQNAFNRYQMMYQPRAEDVVNTLGRQAMYDLSAGRSLTPEEQRIADQTARSAYAARGTALGNQAIGAEILNRADVANQRYLQRQQGAAGIANQMAGLQQQNYAQAMGTQQSAFNQALQQSQADIQRAQAAQQLQAGQAQLGAGALSQLQAYQTPILQAFYKQSIMPNTVPQAQTMGMQNQQAAGNSLFNVESPMAFQSAFLPYQGSVALGAAQLQANAAKSAGQNSMLGQLGGAGIGLLGNSTAMSGLGSALGSIGSLFCWVAREVYGTETGNWKVFRSWMLTQAPAWFRNAYIKYGERVAEFIKNKPTIKAVIRRWMDSKIKVYLGA